MKVAEANATKAAQDVERYKSLVAKDEISKQQYDQAVATLEAAQSDRGRAEGRGGGSAAERCAPPKWRSSRPARSWRRPKPTWKPP